MPEVQVLIPFRYRSWKYGGGAGDSHECSLRYLRIDPGVSPGEMIDLSEQVVERNEHLRRSLGDSRLSIDVITPMSSQAAGAVILTGALTKARRAAAAW